MLRIFLIFLPLIAFCEESFITPLEYGKMLYENPRGIGCIECHGKNGEGKEIASYKHKLKNKKLTAPKINNLSFKEFSSALKQGKKIMPKYYLTQSEMEAIYQYLINLKDKK
ncbi:c-type cytochrome [Helicobacter burdigaliensis]|uniref:c-type cytochrome n=1 Tax=Helicobacter burdigaliensis TaxID=2315334 RepID=UPI001E4256AD|nr:c-type cytochrome [Helicobacter burdigaliensis]